MSRAASRAGKRPVFRLPKIESGFPFRTRQRGAGFQAHARSVVLDLRRVALRTQLLSNRQSNRTNAILPREANDVKWREALLRDSDTPDVSLLTLRHGAQRKPAITIVAKPGTALVTPARFAPASPCEWKAMPTRPRIVYTICTPTALRGQRVLNNRRQRQPHQPTALLRSTP